MPWMLTTTLNIEIKVVLFNLLNYVNIHITASIVYSNRLGQKHFQSFNFLTGY